MVLTIGVTGGIGSGKSSVVSLLAAHGIPVIDADKLGHRAYLPGTSCFATIVRSFGESIIGEDGTINRRQLGPIVFSDRSKMELLNSIVWPEIRALIQQEMQEYKRKGSEIIVVEAAVMIEAGWYDLFDQVWLVTTDEEIAINRLMARNGLSRDQAVVRLRNQPSDVIRQQYAHRVIVNNGSVEDLEAEVNKLLETVNHASEES